MNLICIIAFVLCHLHSTGIWCEQQFRNNQSKNQALLSRHIAAFSRPCNIHCSKSCPCESTNAQNFNFLCLRLQGGAKRCHSKISEEDDSELSSKLSSKRRKSLEEDEMGLRMMKKMGYCGGGLGAKGQGIHEAVEINPSQTRKGVGVEEQKQRKPSKGDFLFSDTSDMADDGMFGPGQFSWKRKMEWKSRVQNALGMEKKRTPKGKRHILDPNDEEGMNDFLTQVDLKYSKNKEREPADVLLRSKPNRTDWQSLDRLTRGRNGLRGSGVAKKSVSSQERKKGRKANIFNLRSRYREDEDIANRQESDSAEQKNSVTPQLGGEFFDPSVPYLDVINQGSPNGMESLVMKSMPDSAEAKRQVIGHDFRTAAFDCPSLMSGVKEVAREAERLMGSWLSSFDPESERKNFPAPVTGSEYGQIASEELNRNTHPIMRCESNIGISQKESMTCSTKTQHQHNKANSKPLSSNARLNSQAAELRSELCVSFTTNPQDISGASIAKDDSSHPFIASSMGLGGKSTQIEPDKSFEVGSAGDRNSIQPSSYMTDIVSVSTLRGAQDRKLDFRDDPATLQELLDQPADGLQRTAPRGGWIRWTRAQVRRVALLMRDCECRLADIGKRIVNGVLDALSFRKMRTNCALLP